LPRAEPHWTTPRRTDVCRHPSLPFRQERQRGGGFVRYYWLDTGEGEGASFGVFRDKAGADESVRLAADFVRTHMAKLLKQKPEIIEGPIKAHD
jgi:hypothetical protein